MLKIVGGHGVENQILLSLPEREFDLVASRLEFVAIKAQDVLLDPGERIEFGFFINGGLVSCLAVLSDGNSVAVGLVGVEGFAGVALAIGFRESLTRAIAQVPGTAFRISAPALSKVLEVCPQLQKALHGYSQMAAVQLTQTAACNLFHEVDQRLARCILMCQDRLKRDSLPFTHDVLAQMLGAHRPNVTHVALFLQKAGLIKSERGRVIILDRQGLADTACECYEAINEQTKAWERD